jgi:hypothetical protein
MLSTGASSSLLSSSILLDDGRYCHIHEYAGRYWRIVDDAENALLILQLFSDTDLEPDEKLSLLCEMLFPEPEKTVEIAGENLAELLAFAVWEICGLDIDGTHKHEYTDSQPCFDWSEDAERIKATLLSTYGIYWDDVKAKISYRELCGLLSMAPHETPFSQAIYYRTAKEPAATKYNQHEIAHFRKAKSFYALKDNQNPFDVMQAENNRAYDTFAMLTRKAVG